MYFPLVLIVFLVALWLGLGAVYGWMKRLYGAFAMVSAIGAVGVVAIAALLVFGPYWKVIYDTLIQPG